MIHITTWYLLLIIKIIYSYIDIILYYMLWLCIVNNINGYCIVLVLYCIVPILESIVLVLYSWKKCYIAQAWTWVAVYPALFPFILLPVNCLWMICDFIHFHLTTHQSIPSSFSVADSQLCKRLCPSIRPSIRPLVRNDRVGKRAFPPLPTRPQLIAV